MTDVVVLTGEGRYADPWHDFAGTSARVAEILTTAGHDAEVRGVATTAPEPARLLVVNTGGGADALPPDPDDAESAWREAVLQHVLAGGPVLALHAATNTFYEDDRWPRAVGGRWVPGTSMHPPYGPATLQVTDRPHPITADLGPEVDVIDERYSYLEVADDVAPLLTQVHDDLVHPVVWARELDGARAVVDTLGHDVAAHGEVRAELLRREVAWLLG